MQAVAGRSGRKRGGLAALVGLILLGLQPAAGASAQTTWYAEKYAAGDVPVRVEYLWARGPLFRSETVIAGQPITTIVRGDRYIILDELSRKGVSIQRAAEALADEKKLPRPFGNELLELQRAGGEFVKTETFGGNECDLYRLTNDEGRREVCVTRDDARLPVLLRVWQRRSQRRMESRYTVWNDRLPVPESFFEPDPRIPLTQVGYQEYVDRASKDLELPAPPLYRDLLHGRGNP